MTFFENKFQRLHAARSWQQKYRIKAVLRLSLWWNGKHPLPPLRLVCFHLSLCFYFSSPPENPHSIFVSYLPLSLTVIEGQTTSCSYGVKTFPHQHPIISWSLHSRYLHTLSLFFTLVFSPSPYTPWQIQFFILPIASTVGWNGANLKKGTVVQKKKKCWHAHAVSLSLSFPFLPRQTCLQLFLRTQIFYHIRSYFKLPLRVTLF